MTSDCLSTMKGLSAKCLTHKAVNLGHGRIEERFIRVIDVRVWLCAVHPRWKDLRSIVAIRSVRTQKKIVATTAETLLEAIRAHLRIENTLHWSLDVTFGEEKTRLRKDNAATNMAVIRNAAFNALKRDPSEIFLKLMRVMAAQDHAFRSFLIGH